MTQWAAPRTNGSAIQWPYAGDSSKLKHAPIIFAILTVVGVVRIVSTYAVFSQTYDEPSHIACGMEWLDRGVYTLETQHPPLARVAAALGPFLNGQRSPKVADVADKARHARSPDLFLAAGNMILNQADYTKTLALARCGVLPFFVLACFLLWRWSRELFGDISALAAIGVFTNVPSVLAHAGLATTDFCFTTTFLLALYGFTNWLKKPSLQSGILQGAGAGLAILSKFSVFVFFPAAAISIVLVRWVMEHRCRFSSWLPNRLRAWTLAVSVLACWLTVWAGYRFSFGPISNFKDRPHHNINRILGGSDVAVAAANFAVETPIPNPELYRGLIWLTAHAREGHTAYILGDVRTSGFWYFFPVAILVKTPIAVLLLAGIGTWSLMTASRASAKDWRWWIPIAVTVPILLVCIASSINLGIRHILPIYPFASMIAGVGFAVLINLRRRSYYFLAGAVILAIWLVSSSAVWHPDYLSYFNEFGWTHPQNILVESDLDWGQDLPRLREDLRRRKVEHFSIGYFGSADLSQQGLPPFEELKPYEPRSGWVAISLTTLQIGGRPKTRPNAGLAYDWLKAYRPSARIGRSMLLYYVPSHE